MNRLFGKKKKQVPQGPSLDETSAKLGEKSDNLETQINNLNVKIQEIGKQMRQPQNKSRLPSLKRKAADLIKRRKALENMQSRVDGQRFNIDNMAFQQTQIQTNIDTVNAMKQSNQVMREQMKNINVDDVDDLALDMEDLMAESNEITDILAAPVGQDIDEGELEGELEGLMDGLDNGEISLDGLGMEEPSKVPVSEKW